MTPDLPGSPWLLHTLLRVGLLCAAAAVLLGLVLRGHRALLARLRGPWAGRLPALRLRGAELVPARRILRLALRAVYWLRGALVLALGYAFLGVLFRFFPQTEPLGRRLSALVWEPARSLLLGLVGYLPKLVVLFLLALLTRAGLALLKAFFHAVEREALSFERFHPEWAVPTYRLVRLGVLALALVLAFPYLPGAGSDAFKAIGLFVGAILSLGSTGVVGNLMAGTLLGYMRPYREGDFVRVAETEGFVVERSLLVTRIRTIQNEEVTLANTKVLESRITNFSTGDEGHRVHLHTSVTIGYEVPWRQVHGLLLAAAGATEGVLAEPAPFVLQAALDDFYVRYEVNAATAHPERLPWIYSGLHQAIQDAFFAAGVEICSPHFAALRDGNTAAIPADQRPEGYRAPAFRIARDPG